MHKNQAVLSIGCGSGELEKEIKKLGSRVFGLDINEKALSEAKKKIDLAVKLDIEKDELEAFFSKSYFDVIIFADVLEHLLNPSLVLKKIKPFLKPEGYIVASLPNIANWKTRFSLLFGRFNYDSYGILDRSHLKLYTFKTSQGLLINSGFKIKKVDFTTNLLNLLYERWGGAFRKNQARIESGACSNGGLVNKFGLRKFMRHFLEKIDYLSGKICKGMFAFQYIFVAVDDKKNV